MTASERSVRRSLLALVCLAAVVGPGCTSVISSAYLRDAFWETAEHAAQTEDEPDDGDPIDEAALAAADEARREAAIEEAVSRLSRLGALDDATRTTLIETLQRTSQEDWPAVVDAFAESLGESAAVTTVSQSPEASAAEPHIVAKADLDAALANERTAPEPQAVPVEPEAAEVLPDTPEPMEQAVLPPAETTEPQPVVTTVSLVQPAPLPFDPPAVPAPEPPPAPLSIRNACFATRVQAWGVVDRFPSDEFRPGQDVIVYFELDGLSAGESPAGHTTCIDTMLRLTAADGTSLHDWSFEPIAETCRSRRHDYFARYVVRIPEAVAAADCRLAIAVTDTLSGEVAEAVLPLAIAAPTP